jgi:hypothetical protein
LRIAWAIPCGWVRRSSTPGRPDLFDCQIDTVQAASPTTEVEFDVAMRIVGTQEDFAAEHLVQVALSDPQMKVLHVFDLPIFPLVPAPHRLPGYELSLHDGVRIAFRPESEGGYDLSFALDGKPEHRLNTTMSVTVLSSE